MVGMWRAIIDPPASGVRNMAVDEAILETVSAGEAPLTLRLYAWRPACLSIGYGQRYREVDETGLRANGWDVVRRATGGKAILHTDELTYSVAAPPEHALMRGGVLPSYRRIAAALLVALESLTVRAATQEKYDRHLAGPGPVCFELPSDWEITWEGRKLAGSAQVRRKGGVLQHGTIPLEGDLARITQALVFESEGNKTEAAARMLRKAATVENAIGRRVGWEAAAAAVCAAFAEMLGEQPVSGGWTAAEEDRAEILAASKYGSPGWTQRR